MQRATERHQRFGQTPRGRVLELDGDEESAEEEPETTDIRCLAINLTLEIKRHAAAADSNATPNTLMDRVRQIRKAERARGEAVLMIGPDGKVSSAVSDDLSGPARICSDVFAHYEGLPSDRLTVAKKMRIAMERTYRDITGFEYALTIRGRRFVIFTYFDPITGGYKSIAIEPYWEEVEKRSLTRLSPCGHIRFREEGANALLTRTLEEAYAKSILWAHGVSSLDS